MNDLSIPHASFFRPPVKFKCVDGFLGIGPAMRDAQEVADPAQFKLEVRINGELKQSIDFSQTVRSAAQLLADVGDFMTLAHGDVLMLGCDAGRPLARAPATASRSARRASRPWSTRSWRRTHEARARRSSKARCTTPSNSDGQLLLRRRPTRRQDDGHLAAAARADAAPTHHPRARPQLRRPREGAGVQGARRSRWCSSKARHADRPPPVHAPPGRRAVHALRMRARGRDRQAPRSKVKRDDACDFVAGYTVANDYAIRDYLENWYRPNLRVKNRDGCTPLGPWLVDAAGRAGPDGAGAAHHGQRQAHAAGQHAGHDLRRALPHRVLQRAS